MSRLKVLITGITGQDGSYLADLLLSKGYEVHGLVRQAALEDSSHRLKHIHRLGEQVILHSGSLESFASVNEVIRQVEPDECYHLAAHSFVSYSFDHEFSTLQTNINGTHHVLAALRSIVPNCRFYFAASSEMFGKVTEIPQVETTRFHPRSVYGISKVTAFELTRNYREAHGMHASSGILFNHESPRRGLAFVTRKITSAVARIMAGKGEPLRLGNLDAKRDWGHAKDFVEAMWLMLQQDTPDDYIVATGRTHSVREFVQMAFGLVGLDYREHVIVDPQLYRPAEVELLVGNPAKAAARLGWSSKTCFESLVWEMVECDCRDLGLNVQRRTARAES